MDNLHRALAPITEAAWAQIEEEARRTFTRNLAGRRVVDVTEPDGPTLAGVGTGHLGRVESPRSGVTARLREVQPLVELRVPFKVTRAAVDDVERGSQDSDWQPVKDAAREMALAEDHALVTGMPSASITGIAPSSSNPAVPLPSDARQVPDAVAQALSALRLVGVGGPYSLLLSAEAYTGLSETTDQGHPVLEHVEHLIGEGRVMWAPAISGGLVLSTRGGDFELTLGQDLSIGYTTHDPEHVHLYLQESLTFRAFTAEASVVLATDR
jgi:uncharacterized linocin/CFP29 family protein